MFCILYYVISLILKIFITTIYITLCNNVILEKMFQHYNLDINMHNKQDNVSEGEPSRNITAISEANGGNADDNFDESSCMILGYSCFVYNCILSF